MSTIVAKRPVKRALRSVSAPPKKYRLAEIAERDSLRRDFEIVREMHGLKPKQSGLAAVHRTAR
ncbi:hypothetical protein FACS1894170_10180 [Planctomycetales bacterium]|nr:hypothetical protein FACS1894170_10180 [Planctomycetales bacterium]